MKSRRRIGSSRRLRQLSDKPMRLTAGHSTLFRDPRGRLEQTLCRARSMSAKGRVSRVSPVQTAVRNCTRDEGGPFEAGRQGQASKPLQAAVVKSDGGERCS